MGPLIIVQNILLAVLVIVMVVMVVVVTITTRIRKGGVVATVTQGGKPVGGSPNPRLFVNEAEG